MPVEFQQPEPVAAAASVYQELARRGRLPGQFNANSFGGGHGSAYAGGGVPYDTGIQDAIFARDRLQFDEQAQVQRTQQGYDLQRMGIEGQMAQDRQHFELQAQLHDVELSQQERMRLQRLKNSIGEVSSDPTLSDQEKADYIQQLKYNIDPLQRRMAQEKLQQEQIVKNSLAERRQADAALEKQRLDIMAKTTDERTTFLADKTMLAQIADDFSKNIGPALTQQFGPQVAQKMIGVMAQQEAMKQGLGTHAYVQPDGKLMPFDKHGGLGHEGEGAGASGGGRGKGPVDHPTGLTASEYTKLHAEVIDSVDKKIAATKKNDAGETVPANPELNNPEARKRAIDSEMKERLDALKQYNDMASPKAAKGYKSPFAAPVAAAAKTPSAGVNATPQAFDWNKPDTPEQKMAVAGWGKSIQDLKEANASPEDRQAAAAALDEMKSLLSKAGSYPAMDADEKRRFNEAKGIVTGVLKAGKRQIPQPQPETPAPVQQPGPITQQTTADGRVIPTPAEAIGNLARKAYGIAEQTAPTLPWWMKRSQR